MSSVRWAAWLPVTIGLLLSACAGYQVPSLVGGSGGLHVKDSLTPAKVPAVNARHPVYIWVRDYRDTRPNAPSRQIGDVRNTHVSDLYSDKITVDENVAALVTAAIKKQLAAGGYKPVGDGDPHARQADFVLSGKVEHFRYDVHSRDEIDLQVQSTLRRAEGGPVLWAGTVKEQSQRFAGVMGDNRNTIVHFLNKGMQNVTRKTLAAINGAITRAQPDLFLQAGAPVPGVTVQAAPPVKAKAAGASAADEKKGVLAVATTPAAVKVYIGDVYYGTTPLKLRLAPGIYEVRLVADGYRDVRQKVSVRLGETTKWDTAMRR